MLHTTYNLVQQYKLGEWNDIWMVPTGMKYDLMKMTVVSHWECVHQEVEKNKAWPYSRNCMNELVTLTVSVVLRGYMYTPIT